MLCFLSSGHKGVGEKIYMDNIRKQFIEDVVKRFIVTYPQEHNEVVKWVKEKRKKNLNKFGADSKLEIRFAMKIPARLFLFLDSSLKNPVDGTRFLDDPEEYNWFCKKFSFYRIGDKF